MLKEITEYTVLRTLKLRTPYGDISYKPGTVLDCIVENDSIFVITKKNIDNRAIYGKLELYWALIFSDNIDKIKLTSDITEEERSLF